VTRPVIGITTYAESARFGIQDTFAAVLPFAYVLAVQDSGARAVLVSPDDTDADVLDRLDGLVLSGGSDIDPSLYGEEPHPTVDPRPKRDAAELLLLESALERDMPVMGICRGMQLMAVQHGGRLHQHLPEVLGHHGHRPVHGPKFGEHLVRVQPGSLAHDILGAEATVNSFHHQGVADPGTLTPTGWCPDDGLIEIVEDPTKQFAIGVQWHPEDTTDFRIFEALVAAAELESVRLGA